VVSPLRLFQLTVQEIAVCSVLGVRLQELSAQLQSKVRQVVLIAAHNTERRAKELVPVDTGDTKSSIMVHPGPGDMEAEVVPSTTYAPFLEFGTHKMAARRAGKGWGTRH